YKYESGKCTEVKNCTNNGMYDTKEDCDKAIKNENRKKCVVSGKCYTTEKNCGTNEYVDEATCKNANPSYSCKKTSDGVCWVKDKYICDEVTLFTAVETCNTIEDGTIYNCSIDEETQCYKRDGLKCDPAQGFYATKELCEKSLQISWLDLFEEKASKFAQCLMPIKPAYAYNYLDKPADDPVWAEPDITCEQCESWFKCNSETSHTLYSGGEWSGGSEKFIQMDVTRDKCDKICGYTIPMICDIPPIDDGEDDRKKEYECVSNDEGCWYKREKVDTCDKWLIIYSDMSEACVSVSSFEVNGSICPDRRCKVCVGQTLKINYTEREMGQYETCRFDGFSVNGTGKILPDNTFTLNEENINKYIGSNFDYWNEDTEEVFIASEESYSKENTEIVFEWYDDEADDAGEHCRAIWSGTYNQWLQDYDATVHYATWSGYLYLESNTIGLDRNTWTLPFDMEIIVTYDKPNVIRYGGGAGVCTCIGNINVDGTETVTLKMPKGSKIGTRVTIQAPEYTRYFVSGSCGGCMCTTMENKKIHQPTITYKINGSTGSSRTIGNIRYSINNI
ncbi:MAG: hypothetical protein J6N45_07200, partial [Alphaproteobacteria bacterium]|nr:hypothetical protein [Alphaproteobacteria bacterium]